MHKTYVYKKINNREIKGDLYPVEHAMAPLIVYIHGGGLIWGTREEILKEQVELYNNAGYHVFSMDYRLAPEAKLPDIIEDVRDAMQWLKNQNFFSFDRNRICVMGSSAGGYLALTTGTFKEKPNVIVSFGGYGNILSDWYLSPSPHYLKTTMVPELLVKQLMMPTQISSASIEKRYAIYLFCRQKGKWPDYVTGLNPTVEKDQLKAFCPIEKVNETFPPTLLLHGEHDEDVPFEESVCFAEVLKSRNVPHDLITIKNGTQAFEQYMTRAQVKEAFTEVLQFIKEHI